MIELVILIIFVLSLGGVIFILARKMPALHSLPHNGTTGIKKHRVISNIETRIKDVLVYFEKQIFLHKFLSWVKIMTLKIETKVDHLLHVIRKNAQQVEKKHKERKQK
jgi:fructose-specific phosphotransferase system component IIB